MTVMNSSTFVLIYITLHNTLVQQLVGEHMKKIIQYVKVVEY